MIFSLALPGSHKGPEYVQPFHLAGLDPNCKCMPKHKVQIYVGKLESILLILSVENFYRHQLENEQNFDMVKFHHLCCGETCDKFVYILLEMLQKKKVLLTVLNGVGRKEVK